MTLDECFSILGIAPTDSKSEIKSAYRDLLFVWHPDRFPNDSKLQAKAGEKLKEINEAYKLLIQYLEFREQEKQARAATQAQQRDHQPPPPPTQDPSHTPPPTPPAGRPPRQPPTPAVPKPSIWHTPINAEYLIPPLLVAISIFGLVMASIDDKPSKPSRSARAPNPTGPSILSMLTPLVPAPTAIPTPTPTWYPKSYRYVPPPPTATPTPVSWYTLETPLPTPMAVYNEPVDSSTILTMWQVPKVEDSTRSMWAKGFTFKDSLNICEYFEWAGFDDWRLPTVKELAESAPERIGLSWAWTPKFGRLARKGEIVKYDKERLAPVVCVRIHPLSRPTVSSDETTQ